SIIDTLDQCPTQAETVNGNDDSDGCPDVVTLQDSDKDGISDDYDKCPIQSEIINNYQDTDGCPDIVPADISTPKSDSEQDNSIFQWTAVIAAIITAAGALGAAKFRKSS
ncbi:MAG: thrombospondin, partial [Nitrosarchaeum sp.]|nr:thrombospondin [Nitrosarchaeum sp.]